MFWAVVNVPFSKNVPSGNETFAPIRYEFGSNILTGNKNSMQGRLEEAVREYGEDLFLKKSRAIDYVKDKFPSIIEAYNNRKKQSK